MRKSKGARIAPYGTPAKTEYTVQDDSLSSVREVALNHSRRSPEIQICESLYRSTLYQTMSKVLLITQTNLLPFPLSTASIVYDRDVLTDAQCTKKALMPYANSKGSDVRAHPCCLIRTVSVHGHILQYPFILSAGNGGPDQPAQMRRLIRACVVRKR